MKTTRINDRSAKIIGRFIIFTVVLLTFFAAILPVFADVMAVPPPIGTGGYYDYDAFNESSYIGYLIKAIAIALIATLALETLFFIIIRYRNKHDLRLLLIANVLTNPPLVLLTCLNDYYGVMDYMSLVLILEVAAVIVEWLIYRAYAEEIKKPFCFALAANAFSYVMGVIIQVVVYI
jgi:hypothetical protein